MLRRYSLNAVSSSANLALASGLVMGAIRGFSLPLIRLSRLSRKVLVSLLSRKATSGSIVSPPSMMFAFLAMRCVSTMISPATMECRVDGADTTVSAASSSARSDSVELRPLMLRTAAPRPSSVWVSFTTTVAFFSVLVHSCTRLSRAPRANGEVGGRLTLPTWPPSDSCLTISENSSRLSRNCLRATTLPNVAWRAALASRCDSVRNLPARAM